MRVELAYNIDRIERIIAEKRAAAAERERLRAICAEAADDEPWY